MPQIIFLIGRDLGQEKNPLSGSELDLEIGCQENGNCELLGRHNFQGRPG